MKNFFNDLNPNQAKAVKHIDNPLLILAGAGSGKTKTITSRVAYLIKEVGIPTDNILTLTFSNKAAKEMRERALNLIANTLIFPPLLCTFHKFGLLFLKRYIYLLNRKNSFLIIDSDDKKKILKEIIFNLDTNFKKILDEYNLKNSVISTKISEYKNSVIMPNEIESRDIEEVVLNKIYELYQENLLENNLLDFDDLLLLPYKILSQFEDIAKEVSEKYKYIMVDEYQDTNELQSRLLKALCFTHNNLCVVGDDDQSIYSFRGAKIDNILNFADKFKSSVIKLEQNYRSSQEILKVANTLISNNKNRYSKNLFSEISHKEVKVSSFYDENEESSSITYKIQELILNGVNPKEIAVLFRVGALSRSIEEALRKANMNYEMIGGIRFYEREEIKDIISYFNSIINSNDDFSFKRIINKPRRKIGKVTLEKLQNAKEDKSLFNFLNEINQSELDKLIGKKSCATLKELINNLNELKKVVDSGDKKTLIYEFENRIKLKAFYSESSEKIANIDEFYAMFADREDTLEVFLNNISLESNDDLANNESVSLMTIHASKGLEFGYVFIIGLEEGFFPLLHDDIEIEEERRIAYVAITRAKRDLILSFVNSRFYRGERTTLQKSRFLIESGLIKENKFKSNNIKFNANINNSGNAKFKRGEVVKHKIFGIGNIIEVSKIGRDFKLKINFANGVKDIVSSFVQKV